MNLIALAESKGLVLCAAESLTAGRIATEIASTPGASRVFLGSIVSYSDLSKTGLLDVEANLIGQRTAVDSEVAIKMAIGARAKFAKVNDLEIEKVLAVSATGVAGPEWVGDKPAGLVFIGISSSRGESVTRVQLEGTRTEISDRAAGAAVTALREELERF